MTTTLNKVKQQIDTLEKDGAQMTGIHLTKTMTDAIRRELK